MGVHYYSMKFLVVVVTVQKGNRSLITCVGVSIFRKVSVLGYISTNSIIMLLSI